MTYLVKEAINLFNNGMYEGALRLFKEASVVYGKHIFEYNLKKCEALLGYSDDDNIRISLRSINKKNLPISSFKEVGLNRLVETYAEFLLNKNKEGVECLDILIAGAEKEKIIEKSKSRFSELVSFIPKQKKTLLIAGHDLRFIDPYINYFKKYYDVLIDKWSGLDEHDREISESLAVKADIIWCEWCCGNAVFYSRNKRNSAKLIVRTHRFEYETNYPNLVNWENVDNAIFIAEGIKDKFLDRFNIKCQASILYNSFDVDKFVVKSLKSKRKIHSLGMIGYMPKLKRVDLAIDLLDILNKDFEKFDLCLKGKSPRDVEWVWGKEKDYFEKFYNRINNKSCIDIAGYDDDVASWISERGFLISSSDIEGSHQAVAEAMAAGTIPIIIGKWAFDYKGYKLYPSEFIFKDLKSAASFINYVIDFGLYDVYSRRVQQFAIDNFSVDVVMHYAMELLELQKVQTKYFPIDSSQTISVLSDLNVNVVDGSSIWLMSIVDVFLQEKNMRVNLFLKNGINEFSEFNKYKKEPRVNLICFPDDNSYSAKEFFDFYLSYEKVNPSYRTIVRAGRDLSKEIIASYKEILSKIIYYIVGNSVSDDILLAPFNSLIVQTNSSYTYIKQKLKFFGKDLEIFVLPPMIPDGFKPNSLIPPDRLKIVYSGKLCKDYMSCEMLEYANSSENNVPFVVVASKIYKNDGEDYVRKTKNQINIAKKGRVVSVVGPMTREETAKIISESSVGWLLRDKKFENSHEISTKLLEYCSLGKPVVLNKFQSNVDLLGNDYPLYVDTVKDIARVISLLESNREFYDILSEYCEFVSKYYKMSKSLERILEFLKGGGSNVVNSSIGFEKYKRNRGYLNSINVAGLNFEEVFLWDELRKNDLKIYTFKKYNKEFKLSLNGVFRNNVDGDAVIVYIKPDGKSRKINGLKHAVDGTAFEYVKVKNRCFFEKLITFQIDFECDFLEIGVRIWKASSTCLYSLSEVNKVGYV